MKLKTENFPKPDPKNLDYQLAILGDFKLLRDEVLKNKKKGASIDRKLGAFKKDTLDRLDAVGSFSKEKIYNLDERLHKLETKKGPFKRFWLWIKSFF